LYFTSTKEIKIEKEENPKQKMSEPTNRPALPRTTRVHAWHARKSYAQAACRLCLWRQDPALSINTNRRLT
jgi:hypothetical protein